MKFARFFLRKVLAGLVTLFLAATLAFFIAKLSGDPTVQMLGLSATPDQVAELKAQLGFDRPILVQYLDFIGDIARGDLGTSLFSGEKNLDAIFGRVWASMQLAVLAVALGALIGIPVGVYAASREGRLGDRVASVLSIVGQSVPVFWLGLILVLVFSLNLGWLPAGFKGDWRNLVLPVFTLATIPIARIARLTRSAMTNSLEDQYITASRARGLSSRRVLFAHGLKNASLPVVTLIGLQIGTLLSGAITVETVFAWPGIGSLATQAVTNRDIPLVQALVVFGAFAFVIINVCVDLLYGVLDPRVRESR
ncbi:MAG: ABC transporter permease [Ilumatobacteraceae bacterium]|jgi:peptide/nickel transport system permease protein